MNKKTIYIFLYIILGIIVSFLVHATIEISVINLLVKDFEKYSLGLAWDQWYLIHHIGSVALLFAGIVFGYSRGKYWWRVIYIHDDKIKLKNISKTYELHKIGKN